MLINSIIGLSLFAAHAAEASSISLLAGTDVPYQLGVGVSYDIKSIKLSVRSGILAGPYSSLTISLIEQLGTPDVYIDLLESAYELGYMNSLSAQIKLGRKKVWLLGPELRFDYLTASDTPSELLEVVIGEPIPTGGRFAKELEVELGLMMYAVGVRTGRIIPLGTTDRSSLLLELSFAKHISAQSQLSINEETPETINTALNDLLWEDVFLPYGYLGGVGVSYSYTF